ncbi:hypothetical protein CC85DRAFT_306080 [Cutaneotrichosporon oleaginosum]|uniref:HMG box domain-containing protein n=1 Tax=Cutaneotrichosporon oleaginosum TaxID=879819 RepID=A0A0J0XB40_9TREE|nr:uncharacterized protein CC85DRAFT_306080 [Cutaneotrichosporon oleaginosum]KLT38311.1 hypothetical protein CC85DRAFT_306080 [Cutaneotrichosporon oleaginosum]TXT07964.1 hypothetical protein COLE_04888 [Cutaneotrichosporon oleaginosum]
MPNTGGVNGAGPHMGQYYPTAASSQQPQAPMDASGQSYVGPTGHEAGVTHSSSIAPNTVGNMSFQPLGGYPQQQSFNAQEYQQLQQQQQQQQQYLGQQQYMHSTGNVSAFPSKVDPSSNAAAALWKSGVYGMAQPHVDGYAQAFEYDQSAGISQVHWNQQQQQMYPPTELFSHMPGPVPPSAQHVASAAGGPPGPSYAPMAPQRSLSPPRSPKAAPKKPPRPPNAWILYRSETLGKMSKGERIPLLEQVLLESYGPPKFAAQPWPVQNESTEEDDGTGANKGPKGFRKGKKGGKDINWYMWMLGLIRSPDGGMPQSDVSRIISNIWKHEPEEQRQYYDKLSQIKKAEHKEMYPGYKFQPQKREDKLREKQEKLKEKEARRQEKEDRVHRNSALKRRKQRRSPSAELSDYHPYHVPGHAPIHKRNSHGPVHELEHLEVPFESFRVPPGAFDATAFPNLSGERVPSGSPSTQASQAPTNGAITGQGPSPHQTPPAGEALNQNPMGSVEGTRPVTWIDVQPVAPPPPQQNNPFPDLASSYQPEMGTESQYYFQPLTGSIPVDFLNGPFDETADDELDNLVKGWAENASNIDVNFNDLTWDTHETTNPLPTEYGGGPIMDAIKQDWNSFFGGDSAGANAMQSGDYGTNMAFSFGNMNLPPGPSLAGALPLSPVDTQQQSEPLPEAKIPDWVVGSRPSASGSNNSLPSPFNTGAGSTPSFTLSVDPSSMGWTAGGELIFDDGTSSAANAGAAPMHAQQQSPQSQSQGQQSRNPSGASAGQYGQA